MDFNLQDDFDDLINERLGAYVYALRDPENSEVFYVGKAGGKKSQGNQRVLDHFVEARNSRENPNDASEKVKRILQIWEKGREVEWFVIRRNLRDEDEALHVEGAIIDILKISAGPSPLNKQSGNKFLEHGSLSKEGVKVLAAPIFGNSLLTMEYFDEERILIFFNISNVYNNQLSPYEATRRSWKLNENIRNNSRVIAVGLVNGISRGAWEISHWNPEKDEKGREKWCFTQCKQLEGLQYVNFSDIVNLPQLKGYWRRGNPVAIKLNNNKEYSIVRGAKDRSEIFTLKR